MRSSICFSCEDSLYVLYDKAAHLKKKPDEQNSLLKEKCEIKACSVVADSSASGSKKSSSVLKMASRTVDKYAVYIKGLDHVIRDGNLIYSIICKYDGNADSSDNLRTFGTPNARA